MEKNNNKFRINFPYININIDDQNNKVREGYVLHSHMKQSHTHPFHVFNFIFQWYFI